MPTLGDHRFCLYVSFYQPGFACFRYIFFPMLCVRVWKMLIAGLIRFFSVFVGDVSRFWPFGCNCMMLANMTYMHVWTRWLHDIMFHVSQASLAEEAARMLQEARINRLCMLCSPLWSGCNGWNVVVAGKCFRTNNFFSRPLLHSPKCSASPELQRQFFSLVVTNGRWNQKFWFSASGRKWLWAMGPKAKP